jgi:hypothetical protein
MKGDSNTKLHKSLIHLDASELMNNLYSDKNSDILDLNIENSYLSDSSSS